MIHLRGTSRFPSLGHFEIMESISESTLKKFESLVYDVQLRYKFVGHYKIIYESHIKLIEADHAYLALKHKELENNGAPLKVLICNSDDVFLSSSDLEKR
jgi:hypothetical protein